MTMAPLTRDKGVVRACFVRAAELFAEMRGEKIVGPQFIELSMGMSSDYELAIEEGATILRIDFCRLKVKKTPENTKYPPKQAEI